MQALITSTIAVTTDGQRNSNMLTSTIERSALTKLFWMLIAIASAIILGSFGATIQLPFLAVVIAFFITLSISFVRGTDGLYILIFAMLFSPEVSSGVTAGKGAGEGAGVVLRIDDVILFAVVLGWILRSAYQGRHAGIVKTSITPAIWTYMAVSIIATLLGMLAGTIRYPASALFHNLKYFEYFLLFFMILAHVRSKETVSKMIWAMFIVFFFVCIYGYYQIAHGIRVSPPFDEEPNTFGGYTVLLMCLAGGMALCDNRARVRTTLVLLILFAIPPLLFSLSRASYLAFITGLMAFLILSHHRVLISAIAIAILAAMMLGLPVLPEPVQERVARTFEKETEYHVQIAGVDFDASSSARIVSYQKALKLWLKRPVLGYGVTGSHFIDGQYIRLLVETGIAGLVAFLAIYWRLLWAVKKVYAHAQDPALKGISMGFFCGIMALLAHAVSANTFIIIRINEPLWLMAGLVLLIPKLESISQPPAKNQNTEDLSDAAV